MAENEILLVDGIEYSLWTHKAEEELEQSIRYHSKEIFGPDSIYFDIKTKIKTSVGLSTVPDAYLINFVKKAFYIIEVELSTHPEYDHINRQIGRFIGALTNYKARQKIASILKEYIDQDITLKKFVDDKLGTRELYQFFLEDILEEVKGQNYHTVVVIDKITDAIVEACNILSPRPRLVELKTFIRANVGDLRVHCHLFEPLFQKRKEEEKTVPSDVRKPDIGRKPGYDNYTGKELERARLFNETIEAKNWRSLLIAVAERLLSKHPEEFNKLADSQIMKGKKSKFLLTKDKRGLRAPYQLSNGLFIETNLSSNSIVRIIKNRLLPSCGYKATDIEILLRE